MKINRTRFSPRVALLFVILAIAPLSLSAYLARVALIPFQESSAPPDTLWAASSRGLALGIAPLKESARFYPSGTWNGKLFRINRFGLDNETILTPGGQWDSAAKIEVYLTNASDKPVAWSNAAKSWTLTFSAKGFKAPELSNLILPDVDYGNPALLEPGKTVKLTLPLAEAFWLWPPVPEGKCRVQVIYDSRELPKVKMKKETHEVYPFRVSNLWLGRIQSPVLEFDAKTAAPEKELSKEKSEEK